MKQTVVIVGGGITGLTAAYRLASLRKKDNLPLEIILLEASNRLGGVISSQMVDNYVIEHGPDAFLADRPEMKSLLADLDLNDDLLATSKNNRRAFVAHHRKLLPLPTGFYLISPTNLWSLFKSKLFSLPGKLRIAFETCLPANRDCETDESVASFIARRFGTELLARAGEPLIGSIYLADVNLLSAQSTLSYFTALEKKHGSIIRGLAKTRDHDSSTASGARYNLFSSFLNGMETIVRRLEEELSDVQIFLNTRLQNITSGSEKKWALETEDGKYFQADAVILAIPAKLTAAIISQLDKKLSAKLATIETIPSVVINLLYRKKDIGHKFNGFGFVVPVTEKQKFMASGWISKKFCHRAPRKHEIVRVFLGGSRAPSLCDLPEEQLIQLAHSQLTPYLQIKAAPQQAWLTRWQHGLPFYRVGHSKIVQAIENYASIYPGLYFAGASYNGVGIPDCVRSGEAAASNAMGFLLKIIQ